MTPRLSHIATALVLACALALAAPAAHAQDGLAVGVRVGVERYDLSDVRRWQEAERAQLEGLGVPAAVTDDFPPYLALGAEVSVPTWWDDRAGLSLRYGSTGGRVAYADYSGSVRADWVVQRWSAGAFVEQRLYQSGPFAAVLALHGLVDHGVVRFEGRTELYDESATDRLPDLTALSFSAEPELGVERAFGPLALRVRGGGGVSFGGMLRVDGERVGLPGSSGASSVQWLGWRFGLTARYAL